MKDFSILTKDDNDHIILGIGEGAVLYETANAGQRLLQKIIVALKQDPGSNILNPEGYSLKSIIGKKLAPTDIEDIKVQLYYNIDKLQKSIIAEQEINSEDSPEGLLEKISIADITADESGQQWSISLIIFDQAGGKTYLKV